MKIPKTTLRVSRFCVLIAGIALISTVALTPQAHAANGYQSLAVVKPAMTCDQLTQASIQTPDGAKVTIKTAVIRQTEKGDYCTITGSTGSGYSFTASLPTDHWTQRFIMGGFGQASGCMPAMNGEFAVGGG